MRLRVISPAECTDAVLELLRDNVGVSTYGVSRGASIRPPGDLVSAEVAREVVNDLVDGIQAVGVHETGSIDLEPASTWISRPALEAERKAPGSSADAVVWSEVLRRAYDESELNWTYLAFITLAMVLATVAILLNSVILIIGAMVLGPEFAPIAAIALALVRRRRTLLRRAIRSLVVGFAVAMIITLLWSLLLRAIGWATYADVTGGRAGMEFIYSPDRWSLVIAVIAGAAGVLSLTSARTTGISGVFISVTTIPAASNIALATAFGAWDEIVGSATQLAINVSGMVLAGLMTLYVQRHLWWRLSLRQRFPLLFEPDDVGS